MSSDLNDLPENWEMALLGEDADIKGRIGWKGYKKEDLRDSGPVVIGGVNVKNSLFLDLSDLKHLTREKYEESPEIMLKNGDVLLVQRGNGIGDCGYFDGSISEATINPTLIIISEFKGDPRFLFYYLVSAKGRENVLSRSSGSSVPAIYQKPLKKLEYPKPPIDIQTKIADFLSAIDKKIELNRQINQTLEQIAQAIFKSWFVDFEPVKAKIEAKQNGQDPERAAMRAISGKTDEELDQLNPDQLQQLTTTAALFPDELEDSELGEIPKEWKVTNFGEVSSCFDSKRVPLSKRQREQRQGNIPYYGATSIMDYVDDFLFDGVYLLTGEDGSVLKENGTPFVQYIWGKSWVNNHAHVLQGKNGVSTEHLMIFIQNQNITAYVTGAVQLKLNQKNMNSIPFIKATDPINHRFQIIIEPLYAKYQQATVEMASLVSLRDSLLPKLISGKIISDVSKISSEAAA